MWVEPHQKPLNIDCGWMVKTYYGTVEKYYKPNTERNGEPYLAN